MKKVALALSISSLAFVTTPAWANGDQKHAESYRKSAVGLHALSAGIGLAGRSDGPLTTPITSADLVVAGLPANAEIDRSFLYWITHAPVGAASIKVKGTDVPGTLIGTGGDTCWLDADVGTKNFVYRADVTSLIDANGPYTLTGFPSGPVDNDTQGASVFIVYRDPSDQTQQGTIIVRDGAMNNNKVPGADDTYPQTTIPDGLTTARFFITAGDGQVLLPDGQLRFNDKPVATVNGQGHFSQSAGRYWDARIFDVRSHLPNSGVLDLRWTNTFIGDCIVFAFTALELQSPSFDGGPSSDLDAGGSSSSSSGASGGASGGAASSSSGAGPADAGSSGDLNITPGGAAPEDSSDGCGCRSATSTISPAGLGIGFALALTLAARRRARRARRGDTKR